MDNQEVPRMDFEHFMIHKGKHFTAFNDESTMADTETINFAFKTPTSANGYIHMVVELSTRAGGLLEILEGATWTAKSGTIFVPINSERNSANTSVIRGNETTTTFTANEIAYDVTTIVTTAATTIEYLRLFGDKKDPVVRRGARELILKADTTYVIRFTADGGTNGANIRLDWYEYIPNVI